MENVSTKKKNYLICYDIRDEKRWRKVYKLLQEYGTRVQYSVFHCQLSDLKLSKLRFELIRRMTGEDSLLIAPIETMDEKKFFVRSPDIPNDQFEPKRFEIF